MNEYLIERAKDIYKDQPNKQDQDRKTTINHIIESIKNDEDTKKYQEFITDKVKQNIDNYSTVRTNYQDLNEVSAYDSIMEFNNLQSYNHLRTYSDIINSYTSNNFYRTLFDDIITTHKSCISEYITLYTNKDLKFKKHYNNLFDESDQLDLLLKMRDLYKVTKDTDNIDLYDEFNGYNNIDISNLLSDATFHSIVNSQNTAKETKTTKETNLVNELLKKNNRIASMVNTRIISNRLFGTLLRNTTNRFTLLNPNIPLVTNNAVTCMDTMYINNQNNTKIYSTRTIGELLLEIVNQENEHVSKTNRKQIYCTFDGKRPRSNDYHKWNGLQVFDIDLKQFQARSGNIIKFKHKLFSHLQDHHWFLFIALSSSGNGIHIYTKVSPPINPFTDDKSVLNVSTTNNEINDTTITDEDKEYMNLHKYSTSIDDTYYDESISASAYKNNLLSKYWYSINYYTKASIIYDIINDIRDELGFIDTDFISTTDTSSYEYGFELKYLDNTVGRITSGIRVTYDKDILINEQFLDLPIHVDLFRTVKNNDPTHIKKCFLRDTKISMKFFEHLNSIITEYNSIITITSNVSTKKTPVSVDSLVLQGYDISTYKELPLHTIKYKIRYEVCNTVASIFGKEGIQLAHQVLRSKECKNEQEINAFFASALRNKKEPTKFGIDILTKCGIVKYVKKEFNEELVDKYKLFLKKQIEKSLIHEKHKYQLQLNDDEYLGSRFDHIISNLIKQDKINLLYAQPSVGKTELIKKLASTKRVMLVLPYISVIKNKIESDESIMEIFECYYNDKNINDMEYGINIVTTFDKFSNTNYEKISRMFDYIVIDEEHLLFNSQYRIHATSRALRNIRKLLYIIANDPFSANIILMTGTPTGSSFFFSNNSNVINVYKKLRNKQMEFHICDDALDTTTRLSYNISQMIQQGYKVIVPTNNGDIYIEKITGMITHLLNRPIKYGYYKRSNNEQDICVSINEHNTVADYELIFCSNYLSVGIDINDIESKFCVCYIGSWSAYEIEQFNSRIRKQNIKSYYFLQTIDSTGKFSEYLYSDPTFQLRLTDDDIRNFNDDKSIAGKKEEFIAEYDPALHTITTPGFSIFGKQIKFDREEYELINFENKYNECFRHPCRIANVLASYGYDINVSTEFDGLDQALQDELKKIGIEAAKEERKEKNTVLVGTIIDLIKCNNYVSPQTKLEFHNVVEWISQNKYSVIENRDLPTFVHVSFNQFAQPEAVSVKSKVALEKILSKVLYLVSRYSTNRCLDIVNKYVDDNDTFQQKKFIRAINLLKIMDHHNNNELSAPIESLIEKIYEFIDIFQVNPDMSIKYSKYTDFIDSLTNEYIDYLGITIRTKYGWDKLRETVESLFNDIAVKDKYGKGMIRFNYNKLPDQDNINVLNRRSIDDLIEKMFNITNDIVSSGKKINMKKQHIIFVDQPF
jgi:hypothetical protein